MSSACGTARKTFRRASTATAAGSVRRLGEFADLEDLGAAVRTRPLDGGTAVFHRHLFGVFDLDLLALFDAITLWHNPSPSGALTAGTVGPQADGWPSTT